jgi:hypothetical protein
MTTNSHGGAPDKFIQAAAASRLGLVQALGRFPPVGFLGLGDWSSGGSQLGLPGSTAGASGSMPGAPGVRGWSF